MLMAWDDCDRQIAAAVHATNFHRTVGSAVAFEGYVNLFQERSSGINGPSVTKSTPTKSC